MAIQRFSFDSFLFDQKKMIFLQQPFQKQRKPNLVPEQGSRLDVARVHGEHEAAVLKRLGKLARLPIESYWWGKLGAIIKNESEKTEPCDRG